MACCGPGRRAWSWINCPETKAYAQDVTWSDFSRDFLFVSLFSSSGMRYACEPCRFAGFIFR
ncbi:hypothetical protein BDW42DRAFT_12618 [Aspergillus taichungensis]|uniref:Uncharacterized protein n=1 Tax=Aspergillus taichungensis TaxID=482145 RepID=A0A2J5HIQ9_9EURO|nr:hypothetical protein BDW42DRAFT_12618 [Aspergillus taichungensis]